MEVQAKVIQVLKAKGGVSARTGKPWASQEYVIETEGEYPKKICIEVFGEDKIKELNLQMNMRYQFSLDIDASEYNGRWYNRIKCWNAIAF